AYGWNAWRFFAWRHYARRRIPSAQRAGVADHSAGTARWQHTGRMRCRFAGWDNPAGDAKPAPGRIRHTGAVRQAAPGNRNSDSGVDHVGREVVGHGFRTRWRETPAGGDR